MNIHFHKRHFEVHFNEEKKTEMIEKNRHLKPKHCKCAININIDGENSNISFSENCQFLFAINKTIN